MWRLNTSLVLLASVLVLIIGGCNGTLAGDDLANLVQERVEFDADDHNAVILALAPTDVRAFGAFGNGNDDDSGRILDAINASNGTVVFPKGSYLIEQGSADGISTFDFGSTQLVFLDGAALKPASNITVRIPGSIIATPSQIFDEQNGQGGRVRFIRNKYVDRVYAEWWGATPDNEADDDWYAVQRALQEVGGYKVDNSQHFGEVASKGVLVGLSGEYSIGRTLTVNSSTKWVGQNWISSADHPADEPTTVYKAKKTGDFSSGAIVEVVRGVDMNLRGFAVHGSWCLPENTHGIRIKDRSWGQMENVSAQWCSGHGIFIDSSNSIRLVDVRAKRNKQDGIHISGFANTRLDHVDSEDNLGDGVDIDEVEGDYGRWGGVVINSIWLEGNREQGIRINGRSNVLILGGRASQAGQYFEQEHYNTDIHPKLYFANGTDGKPPADIYIGPKCSSVQIIGFEPFSQGYEPPSGDEEEGKYVDTIATGNIRIDGGSEQLFDNDGDPLEDASDNPITHQAQGIVIIGVDARRVARPAAGPPHSLFFLHGPSGHGIHPTSGYRQPGIGGETLRMVRGQVKGDGVVDANASSGFTCTRVDTGVYSLTFLSLFDGHPVVSASVLFAPQPPAQPPVPPPGGSSTGPRPQATVALVDDLQAGSCTVRVFGGADVPKDASFAFIAVGKPAN